MIVVGYTLICYLVKKTSAWYKVMPGFTEKVDSQKK